MSESAPEPETDGKSAGSRTAPARVVRLGAAADERDDVVAVEAPLEVRMGPRTATILMRTPGDDADLVRGMLFTEGVIRRGADVLDIRPVSRDAAAGDGAGSLGGTVVEVEFAWPPEGRAAQRFLYSSAACGACGKTSLDALEVRAPGVTAPLRIARSVLHALPARMRAAQPAFGTTGGLHATALFTPEGAVAVLREDVGRHNAFDKAVGWALAQNLVPLSGHVALLSGRASYELVQKAIAAGVPLVAAVGAPSSLAVTLAERFGVTLVGFLREGTANVYSHAGRVAGG